MAKHVLLKIPKGSEFDLLWRGWRRKGKGKVLKRPRLKRAGSFRVALCGCGWESEHKKGLTAFEDAFVEWQAHRDAP